MKHIWNLQWQFWYGKYDLQCRYGFFGSLTLCLAIFANQRSDKVLNFPSQWSLVLYPSLTTHFIGEYSKESPGGSKLACRWANKTCHVWVPKSIHCEGLRISSQPLMIKPTKHGNHQMWFHNITQLYKLHKSSNAAVDLNYDECKPLEIKNIAMWCSMNMIRVTWNISGYNWVVGSCSALRVQIRNLDCFRGLQNNKTNN